MSKKYELVGNVVHISGRPVGRVLRGPKGLIYVTTRRKQHFMVKYHGFGLSLGVIELLAGAGCKEVVIEYKGERERTRYTTPLFQFAQSDLEYTDDTFCEGDVQKFVPRDNFRKEAM